MRDSKVIVKAFDGSKKTVIGEVDLPITIGPHTFQITFQIMDIQAAYSCLLGRPWIHEAGAVTSTLHQKLKFVKNNKLVTVCGERAMMVSHLSSFSYLEPEGVIGTQFQALSISDKEKGASMSSYRDAVRMVSTGATAGWGQVVIPTDNKDKAELGFSSAFSKDMKKDKGSCSLQNTFHSGGFLHPIPQEVDVIDEINNQ